MVAMIKSDHDGNDGSAVVLFGGGGDGRDGRDGRVREERQALSFDLIQTQSGGSNLGDE